MKRILKKGLVNKYSKGGGSTPPYMIRKEIEAYRSLIKAIVEGV